MADEIREILKAAQAAEIQGDKPGAIAHLLKAAAFYEGAGKVDRALQMLRHAQRLDEARRDVIDEIERLEAPATPNESGIAWGNAPADVPGRTRPKRVIERGPTRADPALEAWCSFCCRPKAEIGELVAGPAGAFICAACVRESARLLGPEGSAARAPEPVAPAAPAPTAGPGESAFAARAEKALVEPRDVTFGPVALVDQQDAVDAVERGMTGRRGWILVIGPAGSGKSTYLAELERKGAGHLVRSLDDLLPVYDGKALLLDGLEERDAVAIEELCARAGALGVPVVLAVRGDDVAASLTLEDDKNFTFPLFSTQALVEATQGALPVSVAERIQAVAPFRAQGREQLVEIGRRLVAARTPSLTLSAEALEALAAEAARSSRGAHELKALIARLPASNWGLQIPARPARRARRKGRR